VAFSHSLCAQSFVSYPSSPSNPLVSCFRPWIAKAACLAEQCLGVGRDLSCCVRPWPARGFERGPRTILWPPSRHPVVLRVHLAMTISSRSRRTRPCPTDPEKPWRLSISLRPVPHIVLRSVRRRSVCDGLFLRAARRLLSPRPHRAIPGSVARLFATPARFPGRSCVLFEAAQLPSSIRSHLHGRPTWGVAKEKGMGGGSRTRCASVRAGSGITVRLSSNAPGLLVPRRRVLVVSFLSRSVLLCMWLFIHFYHFLNGLSVPRFPFSPVAYVSSSV